MRDARLAPLIRPASRAHQRGASKFEFAIVVILVSILVGVAANRISLVRGRYEAVAMQGVLGALRSTLGIALAARIVQAPASIDALDGCNPFDLLQGLPGNYGGVITKADGGTLRPGHWYFDAASKTVVYRVRGGRWFNSSLKGPPRARFRVVLDYTDTDGNGRYTPGRDSLHGIDLHSLDDYSWTD